MKCRFCGSTECKEDVCEHCAYLLKNESDEQTLTKMHSDHKTLKIWEENEQIAVRLADAYYESVIRNYKIKENEDDSPETFGYNTYIGGIKTALDIIIPLVSENEQNMIKAKIDAMIEVRRDFNRKMKRRKSVNAG